VIQIKAKRNRATQKDIDGSVCETSLAIYAAGTIAAHSDFIPIPASSVLIVTDSFFESLPAVPAFGEVVYSVMSHSALP